MNTAIGILSIVVAFALLIVLSYKGMSVMYVAPLCALFVALVNYRRHHRIYQRVTPYFPAFYPHWADLCGVRGGGKHCEDADEHLCAQRFRAPKADHCRLHLHCCELGDVFWRN